MTEAVIVEDHNSRDENVFRARLAGISPRRLAEQHGLQLAQVNAIVAKKLVRLDNSYRAQALALDLEMLGELQARTFKTAMTGDIGAGHLLLKIAQRRSDLLGLDAPVRLDLMQVQTHEVSSTAEIRSALDELMKSGPGPRAQADPTPVKGKVDIK